MIDLGPHSHTIWTLVLTALLFWPVRQLIWTLSVRRAQARAQGEAPDGRTMAFLKRKAGLTSALLCFAFSFFYLGSLFGS